MLTLAIHGGAGTISKKYMTPELEAAYHAALNKALQAGYAILEKGGDALDAVVAATVVLEDEPLFNAGRGSVFTHTAAHEMDASVMVGANLDAGAVAGVKGIRNPILLAREIMQHSEHVLLCGSGAADFAALRGMAFEPDSYFYTDLRFEQFQSALKDDQVQLDHTEPDDVERKFGTVGAVACDGRGNLAAATSTGGMTNKKFSRVGDTPLIGCGTYANNRTCAISCTGHGELFIRAVAAYDVSCLMEYRGLSLQEAMDITVNRKLVDIQGEGGMIGVDALGNSALLFNSTGMYRGLVNSGGERYVRIYR